MRAKRRTFSSFGSQSLQFLSVQEAEGNSDEGSNIGIFLLFMATDTEPTEPSPSSTGLQNGSGSGYPGGADEWEETTVTFSDF